MRERQRRHVDILAEERAADQQRAKRVVRRGVERRAPGYVDGAVTDRALKLLGAEEALPVLLGDLEAPVAALFDLFEIGVLDICPGDGSRIVGSEAELDHVFRLGRLTGRERDHHRQRQQASTSILRVMFSLVFLPGCVKSVDSVSGHYHTTSRLSPIVAVPFHEPRDGGAKERTYVRGGAAPGCGQFLYTSISPTTPIREAARLRARMPGRSPRRRTAVRNLPGDPRPRVSLTTSSYPAGCRRLGTEVSERPVRSAPEICRCGAAGADQRCARPRDRGPLDPSTALPSPRWRGGNVRLFR